MTDVSHFITGEWSEPELVRYTSRDLLLYAVGIGCGQGGPKPYNDLRHVYEQDSRFCAFPTFPVSLNMRGHTFDVDTPASSAVYLGQTKATQGPFAQKEAATLPVHGVKVGVDYERLH